MYAAPDPGICYGGGRFTRGAAIMRSCLNGGGGCSPLTTGGGGGGAVRLRRGGGGVQSAYDGWGGERVQSASRILY